MRKIVLVIVAALVLNITAASATPPTSGAPELWSPEVCYRAIDPWAPFHAEFWEGFWAVFIGDA